MKLSRKSWILRYAYGLDGLARVDKTVDLCSLFWRCVGMTALGTFFLSFVGLLLVGIYTNPWGALGFVVMLALLIFGIAFISWTADVISGKDYTLVGTYIHGVKNKYCPRIELKD